MSIAHTRPFFFDTFFVEFDTFCFEKRIDKKSVEFRAEKSATIVSNFEIGSLPGHETEQFLSQNHEIRLENDQQS